MTQTLETAETSLRALIALGKHHDARHTPLEAFLVGFLKVHRGIEQPTLPNAVDGSTTADVKLNHDRWLVECPFCLSACMASENDRRSYCVDCGNGPVGGKWIRVKWPTPATRAAIEQLVAVRPVHARNWTPDEDVRAMEAENAARGIRSGLVR